MVMKKLLHLINVFLSTTSFFLFLTGEFPWQMAILKDDDVGYQCSGSLIHPQVVLSKFFKKL